MPRFFMRRFPMLRRKLAFSLVSLGSLIAALSATLALRAVAHAQAPIRVSVNEVIVPITVTDDKGRCVSNLTKNDFHIFDENKEQKIDFFSHEQAQPIVIGFLIDTSNGMKIHWDKYKEAATELMLNLLPGDKKYTGYLITYGNEPQLVADTNSDSEKMVEKMRHIKPAGGSALYDAIYMACTSRKTVMGEPYEPRRVIIVIGDGHDTASKKSLKEVIEISQRNLVTIYAMSSVAFGFHTDGEENLTTLTAETGGKVETPLNNAYKDVAGYLSNPSDDGNYALQVGTGGYAAEISSSIFRSVASLSGDITTQYVIRYTPDVTLSSEARQFRRIKVAVNLPTVQIRYRNGYYPFAPPN
jgi:Ca-activated chloride channel homolog